MVKYNNNGISRYGNSWGGTLFRLRQEVPVRDRLEQRMIHHLET